MSLLAQLPEASSAASVGWILLALAAVCVALNSIVSFYKEHVKERPTPSETYATKLQHDDFREQMDKELGRERGSRKKIHEEIAALQADTKALKSETDSQTRQLSDLKKQVSDTAARIDDIPKRTIELLNSTKQLHDKS